MANNATCSGGPHRFLGEEVQDSFRKQKITDTGKGSSKVPDTSIAPPGHAVRRFHELYTAKKVETGKVKYLSVEEACTLSSGATTRSSPRKGGLNSQTARTSALSVSPVPSSPFQEAHASMSPGHSKALMLGRTQTSANPKKQPSAFENSRDRKRGNLELHRSNGNGGKKISEDLSKFGEEHLPNSPAIKAAWKGSIGISDFPGVFYNGLVAHHPGKVSRKAYEFSKGMPRILMFTRRPRCEVWPEVFKNSPPAWEIALYFFPGDFYRSCYKYSGLQKLIETDDMSLCCRMDGVELLIFSSKQLPVHSQKMNGRFYLWGVFRSPKRQHSFPSLKENGQMAHVKIEEEEEEEEYPYGPPGFERWPLTTCGFSRPVSGGGAQKGPMEMLVDACRLYQKPQAARPRDDFQKGAVGKSQARRNGPR